MLVHHVKVRFCGTLQKENLGQPEKATTDPFVMDYFSKF